MVVELLDNFNIMNYVPVPSAFVSAIIRKKALFIFGFWIIQAIFLIGIITSFIVADLRQYWSQWGRLAADAAVVLFILTVAPGILRRLHVNDLWPEPQMLLMSFRRQIGIAMFMAATFHYAWSRGFPIIALKLPILPSTLAEFFGMAAWLLAAPLFLTSNNQSVKLLGGNWRRLHKAVYIIVWAIFIHLFLLGRSGWYTTAIFVTAVAEIVSWIKVWGEAK